MRKIEDVIDKIMIAIPEGHQLLKTDLEKVRKDSGYKAPEIVRAS